MHLFAWVRALDRIVLVLMTTISLALSTSGFPPVWADTWFYQPTNLTSNIPGLALHTDPHLVNPWGIALGPQTPFWVADNAAGVTTLYDGIGEPFPPPAPLVVTIPAATSSVDHGTPTGVVFNPTADFVVTLGTNSGPSRFLFATEDGTISGWNSQVNSAVAIRVVDNSATGAVYKGLALAFTAAGPRLYAANFRAGTIDEFDQNFAPVRVSGAFVDRHAPSGFAPFNVAVINGLLYVAYAQQDEDKKDDVPGVGNGFINEFDLEGHFLRRFAQRGRLNSPWGMTLAPFDFGRFGTALLVGNFGDGHILAFDPDSGSFLGQLNDAKGHPLAIEGLWGLAFGNGNVAGPRNLLFFAAGINDEQDGLFGSIQACDRKQGCL